MKENLVQLFFLATEAVLVSWDVFIASYCTCVGSAVEQM